MRVVVLVLWLIFFLSLFAFAVNNTAVTELHFFFGIVWPAPLIAILLVFFLAGVVFGMLGMFPSWFRQRLQLRKLRKTENREASVVAAPSGTNTTTASIDNIADVARAAN